MLNLRLTLFAVFIFSFAKAQVCIDLESGMAGFGYNDVRIPGTTGTLFSLSDDFQNKFSPFFRVRLQYTIAKRHTISGLYAPFQVNNGAVLNKDIFFEHELFKAGDYTRSTWKFNSYRLSYQYNFIMKEKILAGIGLTGKIRDAKIELKNSTVSSRKTNIGFVPLIRFYADFKFAEKFHLVLDGDALVAKQGRAEDVLLAIGYNPKKYFRIKAGYRILEGGADNDEVYNFSAVHYVVAGVVFVFDK